MTRQAASNWELLEAVAYLSRVAEPCSLPVFDAVQRWGYHEAADRIRSGLVGPALTSATEARRACDPRADLEAAERNGITLRFAETTGWPHFALAPLYRHARAVLERGDPRRAPRSEAGRLLPPLALWTKGPLDLADVGTCSAAIVGSRAATPYGLQVAAEFSYSLASEQVHVVSGGAFGIDAAAHRGALAAQGPTVLVSAAGLDRPYPASHSGLFTQVGAHGLLVSERPPGSAPHRQRFLSRNRLIAALGSVTVVVEAARRSGALNSARHARDLDRPVLAVPGPVTSALSVGCHDLVTRQSRPASLATSADDVLRWCRMSSTADRTGGAQQDDERGAAAREHLSVAAAAVLEGMPASDCVTESQLAVLSGVPISAVLAALPELIETAAVTVTRDGYRLGAPGATSGRGPGHTYTDPLSTGVAGGLAPS